MRMGDAPIGLGVCMTTGGQLGVGVSVVVGARVGNKTISVDAGLGVFGVAVPHATTIKTVRINII
jgi:hypothetical protein